MNILDENLRALEQCQVEIIIDFEQGQSIIYNGVSSTFGQVVFQHTSSRLAKVYIDGIFKRRLYYHV